MKKDRDKLPEAKLQMLQSGMDLVPGIVIIQALPELEIVFMSQNGLDQLGMDMMELRQIKDGYEGRCFKTYETEELRKKLKQLVDKNASTETLTFFQQVKTRDHEDWAWYIGSIRIFHRDELGKPTHVLKFIFPVERMKHAPKKAKRLVDETAFFKDNKDKFDNLGTRAKEVLRLVALGKTSAEISRKLNIEVETVNTHRKNIKRKLGIRNSYDFTKYARAYDLI